MTSITHHYVGQRLSFSSSLCTVRYVGLVAGTDGSWLGVEWDDPHAGKHSGTHQGTKYFNCKSTLPKPASFIRPTRPADKPLSFLGALRKKYASSEPLKGGEKAVEISGKVVKEVGFDKIRRQQAAFQELKVVLVDGLCLAGLSSAPWTDQDEPERWRTEIEKITETCPKIIDLNLSRSVLETFKDIVGICKALPALRTLTINGNRLRDFSVTGLTPSCVASAFTGILELNIDDNLLTWNEVVDLTSFFPTLQTLSVGANALQATPIPLSTSTLQTLNLDYNHITSLSNLYPLTRLPNLSSISLHKNSLATLDQCPSFPRLTSLDLFSNLLPSLSSLSPIPTALPALQSLRLSQNPFFAALPIDDAHMLSLARVPSITTLNFSPISEKERQNAEMYYLSRIALELGEAPLEEDWRVLASHPLYGDLCKKYGAPVIKRVAKGEAGPGTLGARLVKLRVVLRRGRDKNGEGGGLEKEYEREEVIRVPKTINVYMLKSVIGKALGVLPVDFKVVWETGEWDPVGMEAGMGKCDENDDSRWNVDDGLEEAEEEPVLQEGLDKKRKGRWVKREVEVVEGTSSVGFWIEGGEATLRIERIR